MRGDCRYAERFAGLSSRRSVVVRRDSEDLLLDRRVFTEAAIAAASTTCGASRKRQLGDSRWVSHTGRVFGER